MTQPIGNVLRMRTPIGGKGCGWSWLLALGLIAAPVEARAEPPVVVWDERIEVDSGTAFRGPWRMNASEFFYVDDPTVAITEENVVGVAWADQTRQNVFFQVYGPDGSPRFAAPVNVSRSPKIFSWLPRMVMAPDDGREVYILWQEIVFSGGSHGGETLFARSLDGGRTFDTPVNLSNSIAGDGKGRLSAHRWHNGSLDIVMNPDGRLYVAWTEYEGRLWFRRSTDRGDTFSEPMLIVGGGASDPARGPALAVDAKGTVHLAWTVGEDKTADIRFATSKDQGRSFGTPQIVSDGDGHADAPKIAVDRQGTVHLVYAESPDGPFERYHIRYARKADGAGAFDEPKEISTPQTGQFDSVGFPALSLDGRDNIYVIWEIFPDRRGWSHGLGLAVSGDGGKTFTAPSIIPGSMDPALGVNGSQQGLLMRKLAVNGSGEIAVVNSTFKRNRTSHIWLTRGRGAKR